jgi:hypothetical protein
MHACPGRFFASNEVKVAVIFLLLRFEWKACGKASEASVHFSWRGSVDGPIVQDVLQTQDARDRYHVVALVRYYTRATGMKGRISKKAGKRRGSKLRF